MPTFECPTCRTVFTVDLLEHAPYRPFCSYHCKMVDLGRWFDGTYRVSEPLSPEKHEDDSGEDKS